MSNYSIDDVCMKGCFKLKDRQQYTLCFGGNTVNRTYADFLKLSHKRKRQTNKEVQKGICTQKNNAEDDKLNQTGSRSKSGHESTNNGLPKKSLNVISSAAPWLKDGEGWQLALKSSVKRVEQWLLDGLNCKEGPNSIVCQDTLCFLSPQCEDAQRNELENRLGSNQESEEQLNARDMQQYFCVEANRNALIQAALSPASENNQTSASSANENSAFRRSRKFVLIEPSCGDGRVLAHILGQRRNVEGEEVQIKNTGSCIVAAVGIDLDPLAAREAKLNLSRIDQFQPGYALDHIPILCQDFLETKGTDLAKLLVNHHQSGDTADRGILDYESNEINESLTTRDGLNSDLPAPTLEWPQSITALIQSEGGVANDVEEDDEIEVLVVGGPPYTDYTPHISSSCSSLLSSERGTLERSSSIRGSELVAKRAKTSSRHNSDSDMANKDIDASSVVNNDMSVGKEINKEDEFWKSCEEENGFRSLPFKFIMKAAKPVTQGGLGASKVAYLLPHRCSKPKFIQAVKDALNKSWMIEEKTKVNSIRDVSKSDTNAQENNFKRKRVIVNTIEWEISATPAPEKNFMFRGKLVPQPSVVFVLNRTTRKL